MGGGEDTWRGLPGASIRAPLSPRHWMDGSACCELPLFGFLPLHWGHPLLGSLHTRPPLTSCLRKRGKLALGTHHHDLSASHQVTASPHPLSTAHGRRGEVGRGPKTPLRGAVAPSGDDFGKENMGLSPLPLSFIFSQGNFVHRWSSPAHLKV